MTILPPKAFEIFCISLVLSTCAVFFCLDLYRLQKAAREPGSPEVRDRIFGAVIGIACSVVGALGVYMHYR